MGGGVAAEHGVNEEFTGPLLEVRTSEKDRDLGDGSRVGRHDGRLGAQQVRVAYRLEGFCLAFNPGS